MWSNDLFLIENVKGKQFKLTLLNLYTSLISSFVLFHFVNISQKFSYQEAAMENFKNWLNEERKVMKWKQEYGFLLPGK